MRDCWEERKLGREHPDVIGASRVLNPIRITALLLLVAQELRLGALISVQLSGMQGLAFELTLLFSRLSPLPDAITCAYGFTRQLGRSSRIR